MMKYRTCSAIVCLVLLASLGTADISQAKQDRANGTAPISTGQILQQTVEVLASEIRSSVSGGQFSRVAVMPFTTLLGDENVLGLYISDKLTSELSVGENALQLVERSQINQALAEMRLGETGFLSEATIQKTGQALGADAVIVGSIVELGGEVDINLRVFSVSTLKILGKASQLIAKDEVIESLLSQTVPTQNGPVAQTDLSGDGDAGSSAPLAQDTVFFFEDFSGIEEGLIPEGWIGGGTLAVKPSENRRGGSILANFKSVGGRGAKVQQHQFTIPNIQFPENWRFELEYIVNQASSRQYFILNIGEIEVKLGMGDKEIYFEGIIAGKTAPLGQINLLAVEKTGTIIKLFVNSKKHKVIRVENLEPPRGISFSYDKDFGIYRLEGTKLP